MGIRTQLQTKVEEEEKRHHQLSLEPATTADISCNPPSPDAIPRELGAVFPAGDLAKLNVTSPETCSVGESASGQCQSATVGRYQCTGTAEVIG